MKNLLLFAFCFFSVLKSPEAQVPMAMPAEANAYYNNSMPLLRPHLKEIVLQTAKALKYHKANADSLSQTLHAHAALKGMSNNNIEGITVLILVQASKDADAELKQMVMEICHRNEQKKEERTTMHRVNVNNIENKNSSTEDINEMENLKIQRIIDRKSRIAEETNYAMKKISGMQQNIINDLK